MKRKRKEHKCYALEFAKEFAEDRELYSNLSYCEKYMEERRDMLNAEFLRSKADARNFARLIFTLHNWCKYRQCYSVTRELAEDLFSMDDLSFPVDALHLPFPCFFLDMEALGESVGDTAAGARLLGYYIMVDEIQYGELPASCCSIIVLGVQDDGSYSYGGVSFDYDPEHMEMDLKDTVENLCRDFPDSRSHITRALLFAAYLSSEQPDITENPAQKAIYRPSDRPRYSSVRKWDVGVRYMAEKRKRAAAAQESADNEKESDILIAGDGVTAKRTPPRPHIRKAHWQTYRTGHGRTGRKVLWIAPITVGLPKGQTQETPAVVRKLKGEESV